MIPRSLSPGRVYYGWIVVATMFITMFMALGIRFSFGIFYVAILDDTGWQRAETALIFSIAMGVYAVAIIFSGALFDRFGPRYSFPVAAVLLSAGIFLCSTIETIWQFYLYYGLLVGLAFSMLGFPTHMAIIPRWFVRKRGLASAVALSGMGAGSLLITLLSEKLITDIGWRSTYLVYSIAIVAILVPINLLFHRHSAEALGLHTDGDAAPRLDAPPAPSQGGITVIQSLSMPTLWFLMIAVTMMGFVTMIMVVHQTRMSIDLGYEKTVAAVMFGITGLVRAGGQLTWGSLSDRFGRTLIFLTASAMSLAGIALIHLTSDTPNLLFLIAFIFLLGAGFMGISPVYAATVSDIFHGRHLGKIMGMLDIGFGFGAAGGPWLAGYLFDRYGFHDYTLGLLAIAICLSAAAMTTTLSLRKRELG